MKSPDAAELNAIKIELTEAILRRMKDDRRSASETFTVSSMAVAEVLADMIHGAANNPEHARRLVTILIGVIANRLNARRTDEQSPQSGQRRAR
jgi:hypothetical protein